MSEILLSTRATPQLFIFTNTVTSAIMTLERFKMHVNVKHHTQGTLMSAIPICGLP